MGKVLIIYDSLGLIPEPSSDFSAKAGPELEGEGGGVLPPLARHPTRTGSQHPVNHILQSMWQKTKPETKPRAFSKLSLSYPLPGVSHPNPDESSVDIKMTG